MKKKYKDSSFSYLIIKKNKNNFGNPLLNPTQPSPEISGYSEIGPMV